MLSRGEESLSGPSGSADVSERNDLSARGVEPESSGVRRHKARVLALTYYFPPVTTGTSQRNVDVMSGLLGVGYVPTVVTGTGRGERFWAPTARDERGAAHGIRIVRVPGPEPPDSRGVRRRVERLLDLKPAWLRWWLEGARAAGRGLASSADLIYASLEPYETAFVASALSRELRVPWVADLFDPWALDESRLHVSVLHRRRDLRRMQASLETAAAVIMNTPEAKARAERIPVLSKKLVSAIPTGYDASDFDGPDPLRDPAAFRIVHAGFLHTERGLRHRKTARVREVLGGSNVPVDILTRSHLFLLKAIDRLLEADPRLADLLQLHLAGNLTDADRKVAEGYPFVRLHGHLTHSESIALMRSADLLFLPMHELPRGVRAGLVPLKTYEYLAAGGPILAAVPEGDARDLLVEAGNAHICWPSDDSAMAQAIAEEIERWRSGHPPSEPRPEVLARYERNVVTNRLAAVFDDVLRSTSAERRLPPQ